ncbi:MAG: type II toxin-antitoxin system VapC family toxin [Terriglobales bacterium]|jgi:predicted nucleic acid-binding protein
MKAVANRFVLDASVAVAWCFDDESTAFTENVLDMLSAGAEAITPAIWPLEVANGLLMAERRKRITVAQVTALLGRIAHLPISVESINPEQVFTQILSVARQLHLTQYDAAYMELALRQALPLATLDGDLRQAARLAGTQLVSV